MLCNPSWLRCDIIPPRIISAFPIRACGDVRRTVNFFIKYDQIISSNNIDLGEYARVARLKQRTVALQVAMGLN